MRYDCECDFLITINVLNRIPYKCSHAVIVSMTLNIIQPLVAINISHSQSRRVNSPYGPFTYVIYSTIAILVCSKCACNWSNFCYYNARKGWCSHASNRNRPIKLRCEWTLKRQVLNNNSFTRMFTLYAKSLPLDLASRVWDIFCRDGEEFLFRTALGKSGIVSGNIWFC